MKIEEINIDGFGKFHKYHCQTSGKLEVFYGKNESGKTTLRKFMIAMLFGLEKSRGLAAKYDDHTRYQPVNGGIYGGSMVFEKDGIRYKIMRNFGQGRQSIAYLMQIRWRNLRERNTYLNPINRHLRIRFR